MRIASVAVLSLVGVLGVAPFARADGWKGPISNYLNPTTTSSTAGVQGNTTLTTNIETPTYTYSGTPTTNGTNSTNSVPVPGTLALFAGGFGVFAAWHRRMQ